MNKKFVYQVGNNKKVPEMEAHLSKWQWEHKKIQTINNGDA